MKQGPHSRACGIAPHDHGPYCHSSCPTCEGRVIQDFNEPKNVLQPGAVTESVDHVAGGKKMLVEYINDQLEKQDRFQIDESYIYVVWFTYTLGNWKMVASTSLPDRMYYEVTHSESKGETYIDAYLKVDNRKLTHV